MAWTITRTTLIDAPDRAAVLAHILTDGSDATDQIIVDKSALSGTFTKLAITKIYVRATHSTVLVFLEWDATTDDPIVAIDEATPLALDFEAYGGFVDPVSAGNTGDVILTSAGVGGAGYIMVLVEVRKVP
jgi:hypothetical protein